MLYSKRGKILQVSIHITSLYAALFGLILLPITMRVGLRRIATKVWFLDGGDDELLRRIRSHANF
ncbi:MAG: MAPEG family protein, partial [Spongiibacteraceae bacterium]|nr:MAPEG family protein [Spongiibacteraceae bacterium]